MGTDRWLWLGENRRPLADDNFHVGWLYRRGDCTRQLELYPHSVLLPLASIGYGPATFQMTYIPGAYNNGNVYFATWMRFFSFN